MLRPRPTTVLEEFKIWLPSELVYSARKAGYDKKIGRAALPIDNPQSMYGFLGNEWFKHQSLRRDGVHYIDDHAMSAQLQLAKFAAGLFDKAAIANWILSGTDAKEANFVMAAEQTAEVAVRRLPIPSAPHVPREIADLPFEQTPFEPGIVSIMNQTVRTVAAEGQERIELATQLRDDAFKLGGLATGCYLVYAYKHLTETQYRLPVSMLAA